MGTPSEPIETDLLIDYYGFENGEELTIPKTLTIYHHSTTIPSFINKFKITSGSYSTTYRTLNTIIITFYSVNNKSITILNTPNSNGIHDIIPRKNLNWEGLRRNTNVNIAPDTSPNPVHGVANNNKKYMIITTDGEVGFGANSTSQCSSYVVPKIGKIKLQTPFAFSFWARTAGDAHPFPHHLDTPVTNGIRFISFGYNTGGGNGGNGFRITTNSASDKTITVEFALGTSTSSNYRLSGPAGDVNFQLTDVDKHIFIWYDGKTLGMTINNKFTITKTNSSLLNWDTNHNSPFFVGGNQNSHTTDTSWRTNKHYMRDLRWYNGYIPNEVERLQLYNHGLLKL